MPRQKLTLEDAIHDSPQTQSMLAIYEEDSELLRKFSQEFYGFCEKIHRAHQELASASRGLTTLMKKYKLIKFPLERNDSCMMTTFPVLAEYMDEISKLQEMAASQISSSMISPISRFISADLEELSQLQNLYRLISDEHEMSAQRYSKLSQRCSEQERCNAIDEVFHMRKKLHRTALHYFSSMNLVQQKRQFVFLECLAGHLQASLALFKGGGDYADKQELDTLHGTTKGLLLCGQRELDLERAAASATVASLEAAYDDSAFLPETLSPPSTSAAEPTPDAPPSATRKSGYLMQRCRPGPPGLASRWERHHFAVRRGRLVRRSRRPPPEVLAAGVGDCGVCLLDLRLPRVASAAPVEDVDDRRHVFVVTSPGLNSPLYLQAESAPSRSDWMTVINASAGVDVTADSSDDSGSDEDETESAAGTDDCISEDEAVEDAADDRFSANQPRMLLGGSVFGSDRSVALLSEDAGCVAGAAFSRTFAVRVLSACRVEAGEDDAATAAAATDAVLQAAAKAGDTGGERLLLAVSDQGVWLLDPASRQMRCRLVLNRARVWPASRRLIGLSDDPPSQKLEHTGRRRQRRRRNLFDCLALRLELDDEGGTIREIAAAAARGQTATAEAVCAALGAAIRSAAGLGHDSGETALLLANIGRLPDSVAGSPTEVAEGPPPTPPPRRPPTRGLACGIADDTDGDDEDDVGSGGGGGESAA